MLAAAQVDEMNATLEGSELFQEEVSAKGRADGTRFTFCQTHPMFMELLEHPTMLGFMREIMGEWFRLDHATGIAMTADAHAKGAPYEVLENLHGGEKGDQGEHHYQYHQVIPPVPPCPHFLDHISPVFSPKVPVFCAFSRARRDGSNEPQAGTQSQETAGTRAKRGELRPSFDTPDA